jgi:hypothetical protein
MATYMAAAMHFPELDASGRCAKKVRHEGTRTEIRCNKGRDDAMHKYYPCLAKVCARRFWSIESRLIHMEKSHR